MGRGKRHSTSELASAIESADDAILAKTRDGILTSWNRGAELLYGYSAEEAVGQHISLIIPPHRRGEENEILAKIVAGEHIVNYQTERQRKDGTLVSVSVSISPIEDAHGEVLGASVVSRQLTQRRPSDETFRALLESAPDAMVITGPDGNIQLVNRQTEFIFGYEREEMLGQPVEMLVPERVRERHGGHRATFFLNPKVRPMGADLDLFGRRKDGQEFPVEISLSPIATEDGLLVSAAIRDVTDRRRAEERFRRFLEFAPDAIVMVDDEGVIIEVNSQTLQLFGYTRDQMVGQPVELLLPQRFRQAHPAHRGGYLASPQVRPMGQGLALYGLRRDGSEFPVDISLAPLETETGVLVSAAIRDISERRRAEEHARRLNEMRMRRRQALELNDEVVQGLTVAQLAHSLGHHKETEKAIASTLAAAQHIIGEMLADETAEDPLAEGDLRRERAALSSPPEVE